MAANYVKFRRGNKAAFDVLLKDGKAELDTLYFIYEEDGASGCFYLGSKLIAGTAAAGATTLNGLDDVEVAAKELLHDKECLIYDITKEQWVNKPIDDILPIFVGADNETGSVAGLVPAAPEGDSNLFLRSDGTWAEIVVASEALVLETVVQAGEDHEAARNREIGDKTLHKGDIIVVKDLIDGEHYQFTSYAYNGTTWVAMDGNYSADKIYFDNDLILTYAFGRYAPDASGKVVVPAKGINLQALLEDAYSQEIKTGLATANPTASVNGSIKYYEIGSTGTQDITVSLYSDGEYKYGFSADPVDGTDGEAATTITNDKTTGVVVDTSVDAPYSLTFDGVALSPKAEKGNVFTLAPVAQTDKASMSIVGTVQHTAGKNPVSNLGKMYPSQKIAAGSVSTSATERARWYVPMYHGFKYSDSVIADPANIAASEVKALSVSKDKDAYDKTKITTETASKAWRQYFLAVPASYDWEMSNAKDGNNIDCTVRQSADVTLSFGSGDTAVDVVYNVYYINNAADYGTLKISWTLA